jgi:hypothetical protein
MKKRAELWFISFIPTPFILIPFRSRPCPHLLHSLPSHPPLSFTPSTPTLLHPFIPTPYPPPPFIPTPSIHHLFHKLLPPPFHSHPFHPRYLPHPFIPTPYPPPPFISPISFSGFPLSASSGCKSDKKTSAAEITPGPSTYIVDG